MAKKLSLREAFAEARRAGCTVDKPRGTGEVRVRHPGVAQACRVNGRRHDAPWALVMFLKRCEAAVDARL